MKALMCLRKLRLFILSLPILLICSAPIRSHAQAFGPPEPSVSSFTEWGINSETVFGNVNENGEADMYGWFEWGTTTSYGNATAQTYFPESFSNNDPSIYDTIYGLSPNTLYHYRVAASNYVGTGYSSDATFVSAGGPVINGQPQGGVVATGTPVTLTVSAYSGLPLDYQWTKDGTNINSATTSQYQIGSAQASDAGTYVAVVSNYYAGYWVVDSNPALLRVGGSPSPTLNTIVSNGNFLFSWPVYYGPGYHLEVSTNLTPGNWNMVSAPLVTNNDTVTTAVPFPVTQGFFRLKYP